MWSKTHCKRSLAFIAMLIGLSMIFGATSELKAQAPVGFTIDYLDSWPMNDQIKYIRIVITPVGGVSSEDLDFYVVAKSQGYRTGVTVSTRIPIRSGDASATGELYVPVSDGYSFTLHAELDGNLKHDMRDFAKHSYNDYYYGANANGLAPSFVFASSKVIADQSLQYKVLTPKGSSRVPRSVSVATANDFIGLSDLESWYGTSPVVGGGRTFMTIDGFSSSQSAAMSLDALPSKWFGYEGLGMIMITLEDLALLKKNHPDKLLAIERWIAASGRLVVLNCGTRLEQVEDALKLLGDSNSILRRQRSCRITSTKGINREVVDAIHEEVEDAIQQANAGYFGVSPNGKFTKERIKSDVGIDTLSLDEAIGTEQLGDLVCIQFDSGQVICVADRLSNWKEERPKDIDSWGELGVFLQATSEQSLHDHNVLGDDPFREFGFPEFAEPPRYVFEFSILFYLVAVGPVAFFVLKSRNRLNLMFIVVPAISLLFCSAILAWAVFAEGFDTRVNLFTFTELNQQTGRQSTSTLTHVYSGMTPSPYTLGGSTYGFVNLPADGRYQRIRWDDQGEAISSGEIRARTNHQLMTRCSNETEKKLAFAFNGTGKEATAFVRNDFDTTIRCLTFRSDACNTNEVWVCVEIAAGEKAEAKRMTFSEAARMISDRMRELGSKTVFASDITFQYEEESGRTRWGPAHSNLQSIGNLSVGSKLNRMWRFSPGVLRAMIFNVEADAFIAFTDQSTNHELAIDDAVLETEIHVIRGVR